MIKVNLLHAKSVISGHWSFLIRFWTNWIYDLDMSEALSFFIIGLLCQIESNLVIAKRWYWWHARDKEPDKEQICNCQVEDTQVHSPINH